MDDPSGFRESEELDWQAPRVRWGSTMTYETTERRLDEVRISSNWSGTNVTAWPHKIVGAPLTKTEAKVLSVIGVGLDLGYWSNPLTYSPVLRCWSKPAKKALYSLLERGHLKIFHEDNPEREIIRRA